MSIDLTEIDKVDEEACINLVAAIIKDAIEDLQITDEEIENSTTEEIRQRKLDNRKSAQRFFKSKHFKYYCGMTNLNPDYILNIIDQMHLKGEKIDGRNTIQ